MNIPWHESTNNRAPTTANATPTATPNRGVTRECGMRTRQKAATPNNRSNNAVLGAIGTLPA